MTTLQRATLLTLPLALAALYGCQDRELPTAITAPEGAAFTMSPASSLIFWDFQNAVNAGAVATAEGAPGVTGISGIATQNCGGPSEVFRDPPLNPADGIRGLFTRTFGPNHCYPYLDITLTAPMHVANITFDHQHNHNSGMPTHPNYQAKLQIQDGGTWSDIGSPLLLEGSNVYHGSLGGRAGATIALSLTLQPGTHRIRWVPQDLAYDDNTRGEYFALNNVRLSGNILYDFSGFFAPVENLPAINLMRAGRAIPIKFSLNGDQGLEIIASDFPRSQQIGCQGGDPGDPLEGTTAGGSSLSYDPATDQYNFVWKTERAWGGTCREFTLRLSDNSEHRLRFRFTD